MSNDYDIRRLQLMQLDILKEVKRVCDKHGFTFYLAFGACLGAVRHKGAIPWDDDLDIIMYAEDFDKFIKCQSDFNEKYFLQTIETDPEFRTMIARVRLNGTTIIEDEFIDCDINQGVFIDIYPLFGYPEGKIAALICSWESLLYRLLLVERAPRNHGKSAMFFGNFLHKIIPKNTKKKIIDYIHNKLRTEAKNSKFVATLYGMDVHPFHTTKYEKAWFGIPSMVSYESMILPAPTDCDSFLKARYGDYMQLPPVERRNSYHNFEFVDLDHSYLNYKGTRYLINQQAKKSVEET